MIDKEKALRLTKGLIIHNNSVLSTKYFKSHEKVAIIYKEHVIELLGGDSKSIKYMDFNIPLSKKEYKEIYMKFMKEVKERKQNSSLKNFNELEILLKNNNT